MTRNSGMLRASFFTLGCKLNQFETAYLAHFFESKGYQLVAFPSEAELYLINTCTVTGKSEHHSRNAVRKAIRTNPDAIVVVTGCGAQVNPESFAAIPGVDLVLGNIEKNRMPLLLELLKKGERARVHVTEWGSKPFLSPMVINRFVDYTRAFIKIQEGCDARCTYCIVPEARGPARSIGFEEVLNQVRNLWGAGYREIVLTGIHLGQYGKDMQPRRHLHELLKGVLKDTGSNRLRMSSIEPNEFTPRLLECIGALSGLCPHFHVPLQSGSGKILRQMGRRYTPAGYRDVIHSILARRPDAAIGADVMVGFPGEDDEDFEKTCQLVAGLSLAYLHVFSYSPRPGTPAAGFQDQVDALVKKARSRRLRELGQQMKDAFRSRFIGMDLDALVLNQSGPGEGYKVALTGNYIPVFIEAGEALVNHMIRVRLSRVTKEGAWGRPISVLN
jgi:threonylcarbamoyladenosine tRNA methylthiotransferase MtaB